MSRCPDARRAEARFDAVLKVVHSIADLVVYYIADEDRHGNLVCKHGPLECEGNKQQLCAALVGPDEGRGAYDPFQLGWDFLQCQNTANFSAVGARELAEWCLKDTDFSHVSADRIRDCWSRSQGTQLLRASAAEARRRGVTKSATIYIGGQYRCTHDDATWYDCPGGSEVEDFIDSVCREQVRLTGSWPDVCDTARR